MNRRLRLFAILLGIILYSAGAATAAAYDDDYLPLAVGKKWILRSSTTQVPIVLEVTGQEGGVYRLRFDNPWIDSELMILPRNGKYYVTAVTMGGKTSQHPKDTLYFDLTATEGKSWSNSIGTMTVVSRNKTVRTATQTYRNCIQIRESNREGNQVFWTFAPGVGFVQFGEGDWAFVLDSSGSAVQEGKGRTSVAAVDGGNYLPLAAGGKWVLRSSTTSVPVVLEVAGQEGGAYRLRFDNPWIDSELMIVPQNGKYFVIAVTMGGRTAASPKDTLYFDLTAPEGKTWSNSIGTMTVVSRNKTVKTPAQTYRNCIQIRETNKEGNNLFWTFAPGVGFVQFGEGNGAFLLDSSGSASQDEGAPANTATPVPTRSSTIGSRPLIGLSATTFANEPFTPAAVKARFNQSLQAGVTYIYLSPKWNELEPHPGKYNMKDIDFQIDQAVQANIPAVCNVRVVDTGNRAMPSDLQQLSFRDRKVQDRLQALLQALIPRFKNRVFLLLIGNEIDGYFKGHRNEISEFGELFSAGANRAKALNPDLQVSASITFDGLDLVDSLLRPLMQRTDFLALTYYPLNPDFTFRNPDDAKRDFSRMIFVARGKKILLQEVGFSSSTLNNSSEDKQARFYGNVFANLRANRDMFYGANFLFMSDLPDSVVNDLAKYYNLPNADRFKAFLRTLGIFDQQGKPKKSWEVFRDQATRMK